MCQTVLQETTSLYLQLFRFAFGCTHKLLSSPYYSAVKTLQNEIELLSILQFYSVWLFSCSFECQGHILGSRRVLTNQMPHILTQDPRPMKRDLPSPEIPDLNPDPSLHTDAPLAGILGPDPGLDHIQEDTKGTW